MLTSYTYYYSQNFAVAMPFFKILFGTWRFLGALDFQPAHPDG